MHDVCRWYGDLPPCGVHQTAVMPSWYGIRHLCCDLGLSMAQVLVSESAADLAINCYCRTGRMASDLLGMNELHVGRCQSLTQVLGRDWSAKVGAGRWGCCTSLLYLGNVRRPPYSSRHDWTTSPPQRHRHRGSRRWLSSQSC